MAEKSDAAERRDLARWQKQLLPFVLIAIFAMGAFFFGSSLIQLNRLSDQITYHPSPRIEQAFVAFEKQDMLSTQADRLDYLRWKTMVMLEQDVIQRRYSQVNATTMLSAWTRHLGFLTGMILALVGAIFILSKLNESQTTLSGEGGGAKAALATSSPGIVLAVLGSVLMTVTLVKEFEFTTTDTPVYIGRSAPTEAALPPPPALEPPKTAQPKNRACLAEARPRMSRRRPPLARSASILAALCTPFAAANASSADYTTGKRNWLDLRYPAAYSPLFNYRASPEGRTAEVDYMLGTSACRIETRRLWGARTLNFVLYSYQLSETSRRLIAAERDRCRAPTPLAAVTPEARQGVERLVAAGATARGKMFSFEGDKSITSYPARQTRVIDPAQLRARLVNVGNVEGINRALKPLAAGSRIAVIGRYAFVTSAGQTDAQLNIIARDLDRYIDFLTREYDIAPPPSYLTIYLEPSIGSLKARADQIHGLDVSMSALGYAYQDDLSTVAFVRGTQSGTLFHELFHLLVRRSFGDIPQWLDEGMASLYEVSAHSAGRQIGLPNWRSRVLRNGLEFSPSLASVIASPWFGFDMARPDTTPAFIVPAERMAISLATARYFALYLQDKGKLTAVYKALRARDPGGADDPAVEAQTLVAAQAGPLDRLQADYNDWIRTMVGRDETNSPDSIGKTLPEPPPTS